jgi:hypothetical protein
MAALMVPTIVQYNTIYKTEIFLLWLLARHNTADSNVLPSAVFPQAARVAEASGASASKEELAAEGHQHLTTAAAAA